METKIQIAKKGQAQDCLICVKNSDLWDAYQYLLAYRFNEEQLELIMIGPYKNYYRDLKKYLKKR